MPQSQNISNLNAKIRDYKDLLLSW